jgi:hypothetical protein
VTAIIRRASCAESVTSQRVALSLSFRRRTVLHQLLFFVVSFEKWPIQPRSSAMSGGRHSKDPESSLIVQLKVWFDRSPIAQRPAILDAIAVEYEMCWSARK